MEIAQICSDLISLLNSGNNSIKDFKEKTEKIYSFCRILSKQEMKQDFIRSSYSPDVIKSIFDMSIVAIKRSSFKSQNFEAVSHFFSCLANSNIPLAKEEKDTQELINVMINIITLHIPQAEDDVWVFWLKVFIEVLKIPTFYNLFRGKLSESDDDESNEVNEDNGISYIKVDSLFALINGLMKFKKIVKKDNYSEQRSLSLVLFSTFLKNSPYPPSPDTIISIFEMSDSFATVQITDNDFNNLLGILNELIAISPISFLINSRTPFSAPFNEKLLSKIFDKWHDYQTNSSLRKSSSAFLLLFLTTMDALKYEINQNVYDKWAKRIIDVWAKFKNRDKIFKSCEDIPYLRADIEFLRRSNESSISQCLLQYILLNGKLNENSNIIWLFTAIGLYEPSIIHQEGWLQILGAINSFKIGDAVWRNQQALPDFYDLISVMADIIESKAQWNNVFIFLIENQPSKEPISSFYKLISKILSQQKIDTKVAHRYQNLLWKERSNVAQFTLERLRCIHTLIYYYGFADNTSRSDCFSSLINLLDSKDSLPIEYLKQLALTVCSIISSHPFPFMPLQTESFKKETIDDICERLKKQLEITAAKKKIESPLQTEELFFITPESSQVQVDDDSSLFDNGNSILSEPMQDEQSQNNEHENANENEEKKFALCNFISKELQNRLVQSIFRKTIQNGQNEWFFMLFLTSLIPDIFSPSEFFDNFKDSFNRDCNATEFPKFFKILLTVSNEIHGEEFQPFFEEIESDFFDIAGQYIGSCDSRIQSFLGDNSGMSWDLLNDIAYDKCFEDLPLFAEFAVQCSHLVPGIDDRFYDCFQDFLLMSAWIPTLHLKICTNLLGLSLPEQQKADIISSLETVTVRVLQILLVPVKERDIFLEELFRALIYDNSEPMASLFKSISNYPITPSMKSGLLYIMQYNYKFSNMIFDCFWDSYSPFFVSDDYPTIRLQSIDTIISILKLKEFVVNKGYEIINQKFEKDIYFKEFISPFIEEILEEADWKICKQTVFTAIKTLIQIAAEIPELTTKCLFIIIDSFTLHDYKIFPLQCINVLFSGLSTRIHFSFFLRQFIPMLITQLDRLTDRLADYPFELFFLDESNVSNNEAKRMFCDIAAPFAMAYSIANSKQEMINFFTASLKKQQKEIIFENSLYICSYILDALNEDQTEDDRSMLQNMYKQLISNQKFYSPIPLLSFVSMTSEEAIQKSYNIILDQNAYTQQFLDIRSFIFMLYKTIFRAHHELVQSYYLQQFTLYVSILFQAHGDKINEKPTLYSDILALTVNLIEFVPQSESSNLLNAISSNIPENFSMEMVGFVKNIEDICKNLGNHPCLQNFFIRFENLIDEILIFDFLKERQLANRKPYMEFGRIAKTRRLNQESIDFLLKSFIEDPESILEIDSLPNEMKRIVLNEIYQFAIKNPQTLALQLYSEMFLNFIHIHPSPLIIGSDLNAPVLLFQKLLELARDMNPSISRSALTALCDIVSRSLLPKAVVDDKFLTLQLIQYQNYAKPRKSMKKPDEDSPWICKFVCKYIEQMDVASLCYSFGSIAAVSPEFCEQLFPHLFIECLKGPLFDQIYNEFKRFADDPKKNFEECRLFISAFNYLRANIFRDHVPDEPEWHLKWCGKHFDFEKIMEVCLKIGDPFSAYQYAEFAREDVNMSDEPLNRIFTHLGVNDLKYGLDHDFSNPLSVADLHKQEGRLGKSLVLYDNGNDVQMMSDTLCELHLYNLLGNMKISLSDKSIESLWRLRKWDVSSAIMREMNSKAHSASLFAVMQAFATNNEEAIIQKLNEFSQQFHFDLNSSVYTQLSYLLNASALQWFHAVTFRDSSKLFDLFPRSIISIYRSSLEKITNLSRQFYKITESANALHGVFFCILSELCSKISFPGIPPKFFSDVITNSLENNEIESAQYFISLLHENQKEIPQYANFEQIRVLYAETPHRAVSLLKKNYDQILLKPNQLDSDKRRNVFNLRVEFAQAAWCAQTNYLPSAQIFEQLAIVIEKCEANNSIDLMAEAQFTLARFFHRQHRETCDYFMSTEYSTIVGIIEYEKACLSGKTALKRSSSVLNAKEDIKNYESMIQDKKEKFSTTIVGAIENYMNVLKHSSKFDLECSLSIIGLWFDYSYTKYQQFVQEVPDLIETMDEIFPDIDPIKFLPLFYQLAARIDEAGKISSTQNVEYNSSFQSFLRRMVISICQKCPNECFPVLFALEKNNEGKKKVDAIQELISNLTDISTELSERWYQMYQLLSSYERLASAPQMSQKTNSLPRLDQKLRECTTDKMKYVTIITNSKEVGIVSFENKLGVLIGVNRPLLLRLIGDDGKRYRQIVKGNKDDLRQDAVMQQLFVLSSKLLSRKNPNLSIRHYKVVPLSPKTGVIEFVENSISIQNYLFYKDEKKETHGAHTRYYINGENEPYLTSLREFQEQSTNYHKNLEKTEESRQRLINFFIDLRKKINPVFHFFFIERFTNTGDWFVSRLRYCRHTATNSIVGHVLGIGDRHLNNIMIDKKTGEVIHIDLGIAFDQGKALPISENVPFRLTNEIIDGMGWMGKEGVFRKTCEETMAVLRTNSEYLLTVLKVFMSDPLYTWNLVPKTQRSSSLSLSPAGLPPTSNMKNKNKIAESVIVTCQRKLEGRETGESLSIEGQVSNLINEATNDENLALMYIGWKPFL